MMFVFFFVLNSFPKSTSEGLGREKVDLRKPLFYLSKTMVFDLGAFPGTPKNVPGSAFKIHCDFASNFTPKMTPLGLPFGTFFVPKWLREIGPGEFFDGCSPQPLPKPPKAVPRTSPRHPGTPPGPPRDHPGTADDPPGLPQDAAKLQKSSPRAPKIIPPSANPSTHQPIDP